jgi:RimJ/RimL family protein N-acetyltransferase
MTAIVESHAAPAASPRIFLARDGRHLVLCHVGRDAAALADLLLRLSAQTRRLRYHAPRQCSLEEVWRETGRICRGNEATGLALVAIAPRPWGDEALAVAELMPDPHEPATGHLAVVVRDDQQALGIGTALLRLLLTEARHGVLTTVRADLLAENRAARRLLGHLGLPHTTRTRHGVSEVCARLVPDTAHSAA